MPLSSAELDDLRAAKALLDHPGLVARISEVIGAPIEKGFDMLPKRWIGIVDDAARRAIAKALEVALSTLKDGQPGASSNRWHQLAVGATGAMGGAFGLAALALELPVSTTIMLRSIADVARSEGEDLQTPDAQMACVQVLAMGSPGPADDAAETGYFAARAAMAQAVTEALRHVAQKGVTQRNASAMVRLIGQVASRFSINVSEKVAAQALPIIGALGGAVVNTLFIQHFQNMARGHFIVRRLERRHGADVVKQAYKAL